MATVKEVTEALANLHSKCLDREFCKTVKLRDWGERDLLPIIGAFLLGKFGSVHREYTVNLGPMRWGRIDFVVDNVAVEVAVRRPNYAKQLLGMPVNVTEIKKLMKYDGRRLLVLFDFSKNNPFTRNELEMFKTWRNVANKGRPANSYPPFNLAYYYISKRKPVEAAMIRMSIRIKRRAGQVEIAAPPEITEETSAGSDMMGVFDGAVDTRDAIGP